MMTKKEFKAAMNLPYVSAMAVFAEVLNNESEDTLDMYGLLDEMNDDYRAWANENRKHEDKWSRIYTGLTVTIDNLYMMENYG